MRILQCLKVACLSGLLVCAALSASAHPLPDTRVTVGFTETSLALTIRVPVEDLALVLTDLPDLEDSTLTPEETSALGAYFKAHTRLITVAGTPIPITVEGVRIATASAPDVGAYEEAEISVATAPVSPGPILLAYDAVIHRIATHRAYLVTPDGKFLDLIRFDQSTQTIPPIRIDRP